MIVLDGRRRFQVVFGEILGDDVVDFGGGGFDLVTIFFVDRGTFMTGPLGGVLTAAGRSTLSSRLFSRLGSALAATLAFPGRSDFSAETDIDVGTKSPTTAVRKKNPNRAFMQATCKCSIKTGKVSRKERVFIIFRVLRKFQMPDEIFANFRRLSSV